MPKRTIDWTPELLARLGREQDVDLAREIGCSSTAIYLKRKAQNIPAAPNPAVVRFAAWLDAQPGRMDDLPVGEIVRVSGERISFGAAWRVLRERGRPRGRVTGAPDKWAFVDWRLPDRVLAEIWGVSQHAIRLSRADNRHPLPTWRVRGKAGALRPAYEAAVESERARAAGLPLGTPPASPPDTAPVARGAPPKADRAEVLRRLASGESPAEVAGAVGLSARRVYQIVGPKRGKPRLRLDRREAAEWRLREGRSIRAVARELGMSRSTVVRVRNEMED